MSLRRIAELRRGKRTSALRSSRAIRDRDLPRVMHSKSGGLLFEFVSGGKASIFVRKTLQVRLRDRKMQSILQARREGPAFFDEDDACAGLGASMQPVIKCAPVLELRCSPS